jgi:hypothetical protein
MLRLLGIGLHGLDSVQERGKKMRYIRTRYSGLLSFCLQCVGAGLIIHSTLQELMATASAVPEIDGGSLTAGLGLLAGVSMILVARRNRP